MCPFCAVVSCDVRGDIQANQACVMSKAAGAAAFRKTWDKEAFEEKAKARLDEELKLEEEREANIQAPQPIVQRAPLQRREADLQLTKFVNTRQMVTLGQAANGEMTGVYYCNVCECHLRDSANYLLHINGAKARPEQHSPHPHTHPERSPDPDPNHNLDPFLTPPLTHAGKKHNRMLGMSMRAERATLGEVRERLASYKDDKQVELTKEEKAAMFLEDFNQVS